MCAGYFDNMSEKRKVSLLLNFLGQAGIKLYNTFDFRPEIPAADGVDAVPAEDKK